MPPAARPNANRTTPAPARGPSPGGVGLVVVACVAAALMITVRDQERSFEEAREDFVAEQVSLASIAAAHLSTELAMVRHDALLAAEEVAQGGRPSPAIAQGYLDLRVRAAGEPTLPAPASNGDALVLTVPAPDGRAVDVVVSLGRILRAMTAPHRVGEHQVLLHPPGTRWFYTGEGRALRAEFVARALGQDRSSVLLSRDEAAQLGLGQRTAEAGLARVDGGPLGQWQLAVVASRARLRDREWHSTWRLLAGQLFTIGAMLGLGGFAVWAERRKLEAQRRLADAERQRERESQLDRESRAAAMVTLAAGVAHEVSSPLGVISGRAEQLLARAGDDARAARGAQAILQETEHIRQVIRGFLDLARGDMPPLERVAPREVVRRSVALCEHRFASAGVELRTDAPEGLPPVRGDARLLEQALVNLLLNACDACKRGCAVEVSARAEDGAVRFTVTDDGSGISAQDAARAAEPFFTTKPAGQGTGLGLAITNEIMKIHRGTLALAPRAEGGTVASVRVPVATADADPVG